MLKSYKVIFLVLCFCVILVYSMILVKYFDNLLFVIFIKRFNNKDGFKFSEITNVSVHHKEYNYTNSKETQQTSFPSSIESSIKSSSIRSTTISVQKIPYENALVSTKYFINGLGKNISIGSNKLNTSKPSEPKHSLLENDERISVNISTTSNLVHSEKNFFDLMSHRSKRIKDTCKGKTSSLNTEGIFWIPNKYIAYCAVPKAASSTWLTYMIETLERSKKDKDEAKLRFPDNNYSILRHLGVARPYFKKWSKYVSQLPVNHLTGFVIVRHPFHRLVSAYRSKLEIRNLVDPFFFENYGKHIVQKYRTKAISVLGSGYFSESNNYGTPIKPTSGQRDSKLPTFWEFVQAIVDRSIKMDAHWTPIHQFCSICHPITQKAFQYILKIESIEDEKIMLLKKLKWDKKLDLKKSLNAIKPQGLSEEEITRMYFSVLSNNQIISLYNIYKLDFLLFDYSFEYNKQHFP